MLLKGVSYAHQGCINLIKNTVKPYTVKKKFPAIKAIFSIITPVFNVT